MPVPGGPPRAADGSIDTDVLIVGAGVAGLFAAVELARLAPATSIVVLDKGTPGASGSSPWAQGGVAVAVGVDDSPLLHAEDTRRAGDGLCDPVAVEMLTSDGPDRLHQLIDLGAEFDRDADGSLHLAREGGQRVARSVHRADATGAEMVRALRTAATPVVSRLGAIAHSLVRRSDGRIVGCWALEDGAPVAVRARATLLASGGCGGLFAATTNRDHATADGIALAWRAGAALRDLEFVQFHPTALGVDASGWRLLLTEALRGAGATLHDRDGHRFMLEVHPDAELAPRHIVTRAIVERGDVWLDARHLGQRRLEEEFPTVLTGARTHGADLATERVPVTPAAHYQVGGVRTDLDGRTSVPGLWAAGEVAVTGVHGANRMAGNSLLEALVFGGRAAADIVRNLSDDTPRLGPPPTLEPAPSVDTAAARRRLREVMWRGCGPVRNAASLADAASAIAELTVELGRPSADREHVELLHAVTAAGLLVRAAAARTETRGGHVRTDHPARESTWDDVHLEWIAS